MKIRITVYKDSGKYYTDGIAESEKDIWMWEDKFMEFVKNNLPARIGEGFVVVEDVLDDQSFHQALYRYNEFK